MLYDLSSNGVQKWSRLRIYNRIQYLKKTYRIMRLAFLQERFNF